MTDGNGYTLSDIAAVTGGGNGRSDGAFGGDWGAWIILFLLFGLFGRGGYGNFGGGSGDNGGGGGGYGIPFFAPYATKADVSEGFALNNLQSGITAIQQGICDSTSALNNTIQNGFNTTQVGMMQGFNGVERGFCNLSSQIAKCCCDVERGMDGINYNMAKNTCDIQNTIHNTTRDILDSNNANTRAILDFLTQDKISTLQAENQSLRFAASQANQNAVLQAAMDANTAEIIRRTGNDCPVPAYVVQPPAQVTFPTNCCGQFTGYNNGGCGCGGNGFNGTF